MDDMHGLSATAIGMTALGRLHLRVPADGGFEEVVVERRWSDAAAARAWCERTVRRSDPGTSVLEVQVFSERWHHPRSWETTRSRPVAESLQLGVVDEGVGIRWSESRPMAPLTGVRHVY
jgi:hypothetical protein